MLKITSDGRKLGLDQRLIDPNFPDNPDSKVNMCVNNVFRIWRDGQKDKLTQLIFSDLSTPKAAVAATRDKTAMAAGNKIAGGTELHALGNLMADIQPDPPFSVYEDIRGKLVSLGIPEREIAFIHDANTDVKKKSLFAKVRSGQVPLYGIQPGKSSILLESHSAKLDIFIDVARKNILALEQEKPSVKKKLCAQPDEVPPAKKPREQTPER